MNDNDRYMLKVIGAYQKVIDAKADFLAARECPEYRLIDIRRDGLTKAMARLKRLVPAELRNELPVSLKGIEELCATTKIS